jgi:hypothetical protein
MLLRLLPRGRAWQSNEGGPLPYHVAAFDPAVFDPAVFDAEDKPGTILFRFIAALSHVFHFLRARLCSLRLEIWCQTKNETTPEWLAEYALPDDCDPFPDLCEKVAALGGSRCEYFNARIARKGWRVPSVAAVVSAIAVTAPGMAAWETPRAMR